MASSVDEIIGKINTIHHKLIKYDRYEKKNHRKLKQCKLNLKKMRIVYQKHVLFIEQGVCIKEGSHYYNKIIRIWNNIQNATFHKDKLNLRSSVINEKICKYQSSYNKLVFSLKKLNLSAHDKQILDFYLNAGVISD